MSTPATSANGPPPRDDPSDERDELAQRLAFLQLTPVDAERLRGLSPAFAAAAEEFVEDFYAHLFRFEMTSRFLQDPVMVARLKASQRSHFVSMLAAEWDDDYVRRRRHVGDVHAGVGIEPELFLGAYNQYVQFFFPRFVDSDTPECVAGMDLLRSLMKAIFLDIGLTLEAYFRQSTRQLRLALDMVGKANEQLRQFAQLTSHDMKTPLATVANLCDEVLDEFGPQIPADAARLITAARDRVFRMSTTINELLHSSLSAASSEDELVSSGEFIDEAVDRVRTLLEKKGIVLAIQRPLPKVWGNRVRLREAFYNLISNAAKFMDKQPGRIEIRAVHSEAECILTVADNGPGIPPDELPRLFQPFRRQLQQPPPHTPGSGEWGAGSGLGLYFAKTIIEQCGGRIWVDSILGHGSQFHIALPRGETGQ